MDHGQQPLGAAQVHRDARVEVLHGGHAPPGTAARRGRRSAPRGRAGPSARGARGPAAAARPRRSATGAPAPATGRRPASMASASSSSPPTVRARAATCTPEAPSARATAKPRPRLAPVTSATRDGGCHAGTLSRKPRVDAVGGLHGIVAGEAGVAELRLRGAAPALLAAGAVEPVERDELAGCRRRRSRASPPRSWWRRAASRGRACRRRRSRATGSAARRCGNAPRRRRRPSPSRGSCGEVVPRTTESSTSTMRLPAITARLTLSFSRTPMLRICSVGSMKVRPTYWLRMIPMA